MSDNCEALQVPSEHEWLRKFFIERTPVNVLEIGVWMGGTLRTWIEAGSKSTHYVAVDLAHPNASEYGRWIDNSRLVAIWGSSILEEVKYVVRRLCPYDFIFIDGDHDYDVVKEDVTFALGIATGRGVIVMHDIVDGEGNIYGPGRMLNVCEKMGYYVERIIHVGQGAPHGLGVIYL